MFDSLVGSSAGQVAEAAEACLAGLLAQEARLLAVAAAWADCHPGDLDGDWRSPAVDVPRQLGGPGTPLVGRFGLAELGALLRTSTGGAEHLIADALDLRHRLPRLWARVQAGQVRSWQARAVAKATRRLDPAAAAAVDAAVAEPITTLSWARFQHRLEAAVLAADPADAAAAAAQADAERFVRAGRTSEHGLRLLVARAAAGDVVWFLAMINRLAEILALEGDLDPVDVRRSKAIGIIAQPARALQLLLAHQHDQPGPAEPIEAADPEAAEPEAAEPEQVDPDPAAPAPTGPAPTGPAPTRRGAPPSTTPAEEAHTSVVFGPLPLDPAACRPRAVVYVHLSEEALTAGAGIARVEHIGPVLADRLRQLLGADPQIILKPVLDLADTSPVDGYEVPDRIRENLQLRCPGETFPWGTTSSRWADLDHTVPYLALDRGGPPGQTRIGNLGPLSRSHHLVKTFTSWRVRQPDPGTWVWRSPLGRHYLVTAAGTFPLGRTDFASQLWQLADDRSRGQPRAPAA
jgi:hypothetical protein